MIPKECYLTIINSDINGYSLQYFTLRITRNHMSLKNMLIISWHSYCMYQAIDDFVTNSLKLNGIENAYKDTDC